MAALKVTLFLLFASSVESVPIWPRSHQQLSSPEGKENDMVHVLEAKKAVVDEVYLCD